MVKLWKVVVVHSHFGEVIQIVGNSIIVGIKIFNIVGGLRIVGGLSRGFGLWQLIVLGLR